MNCWESEWSGETNPIAITKFELALVIEILRVMRELTTIFVLTGGGPADSTQTISLFTYIQAFSFYNISYAAAAGVIMLLACAVVSTILTRRAAMAVVS